MNDEMHRLLCMEYQKILSRGVMYDEIMLLIDSDKYRFIFTYDNKTYKCTPLGHTYNNPMLDGIVTHIITTRKIAICDINIIIRVMVRLLKSNINIEKYFSFYTESEITLMCNTNDYSVSILLHNHTKICFTILFQCVIYDNNILFNYILHYMRNHNINIIIPSTQPLIYANDSIYKMNPNAFNLITDYAELLSFNKSLRGCWITACITV